LRREALCALYSCLQGQIKPRTACDTACDTACADGITSSADGLCLNHHTTSHLTYPQQQAIMSAVCLMHEPVSWCWLMHQFMSAVLSVQSCKHSFAKCLARAACSVSFEAPLLKTSMFYCHMLLHIVFCPMQLSFMLQMAAAWSSGAVA
jgi:hypothetical protein